MAVNLTPVGCTVAGNEWPPFTEAFMCLLCVATHLSALCNVEHARTRDCTHEH